MKHVKKLASVLLAVVMLLATATTAFAADANDGSITVRNATVNETYSVYKVFDLTYSGSNVSYFYTKAGDDALYTALTKDDSPFTLTETSTTDKYNVALKDGKTAADVSKWLGDNEGLLTETDRKTANADTVVFTGLAYGYYYITSTVGSVVTIDSTLKDVKIVDKNQIPFWDNEDGDHPDPENPGPGKVIVNADGSKTTINSANYGDTVNFSIAVNAVAYAKNANGETKLVTYYHIKDTLSDGFNDAQNIVVKVNNNVISASDYTIKQDGKTFTVDIPFGEKYGSNAKIEVTYSAVVNNAAVLAGAGNPNTANFTYSTDDENDPSDPPYDPKNPDDPEYPKDPGDRNYKEENKKTTTTYVYALGIKKVDEKGNALKGAEFTVADANGELINATGNDGVYEFCADGTQGAVTQFKTNDEGILLIKGLAAGTYSVKEVVAPNGYNLLTESVTVKAEIAKNETYTETITTYKDANGNVTATEVTGGSKETTTVAARVVPLVVVNKTGTELPSTGGIGTTIFYVLGGLLVAGAAVLLVVKKRMNGANQ